MKHAVIPKEKKGVDKRNRVRMRISLIETLSEKYML